MQMFPRIMKVCCTRAPAFTHVRAIATLANSVKLMGVDKPANLRILGTHRQLHAKPVWLAFLLLRGNCGQLYSFFVRRSFSVG